MEIEERTPPVILRRVDAMDDSLYDWERLYDVVKNRVDVDFLRPKKTLREHQLAALDAVKTGFESADRGKLIMACGTGKTLTSLRITETRAFFERGSYANVF